LFVLNNDHRKWLTGREMNFAEDKVCLSSDFWKAAVEPAKKYDVDGIMERFVADIGFTNNKENS